MFPNLWVAITKRLGNTGVEYKSLWETVKSAESKAKFGKYDELYKRLQTKEGGKKVYKLVKGREKQSRDFLNV